MVGTLLHNSRIAAILVVLCGMTILSPSFVDCQAVRQSPKKHRTTMGVDYYLHLFDLKTYKEKVLPAYQQFSRRDDPEPVVALIRLCMRELEANPQLSDHLFWGPDSCTEDIGIVTGAIPYNPDGGHRSKERDKGKAYRVRQDYARGLLSSRILQVLCVPHKKGVSPEQNMGRTALVPYLYEHSAWITDLFTGERRVRGQVLELSIGESSQVFSKQDVRDFSEELRKVPQPTDAQLKKEYDNLSALLRLALDDPELTVLLSLQ